MPYRYCIVIVLLLLSGCSAHNRYKTKGSALPKRSSRYSTEKKNSTKTIVKKRNNKSKHGTENEIIEDLKKAGEGDKDYLHTDENSSQKTFYAVCSFYGEDFHGKTAADGSIYDMYKMTCAHKTMPFGTELLVTNEDNGNSVRVIVTDRGPFIEGRDIDLSYAAAKELGITGEGVKKLKIRIIAFGK